MPKPLTGAPQAQFPKRVALRGTTEPMPTLTGRAVKGHAESYAENHAAETQPWRVPVRQPSYHPTGWALADRALDKVDALTNGRADWAQRAFSYLFIGGCASLVNLAVFYLVLYRVALPIGAHTHYLVANLLAAEISLIANFIPNDRITFRHLPGHDRSWLVRCARFHVTAIGGVIVTAVVSLGLHFLGVPGLLAQAGAILVALIWNFTFHHLYTYRHIAPASH